MASDAWTFVLAFSGGGLGAIVAPVITAKTGRSARMRDVRGQPYSDLMLAAIELRDALSISWWPEWYESPRIEPALDGFKAAQDRLRSIASDEVTDLADELIAATYKFRAVRQTHARPDQVAEHATVDEDAMMRGFIAAKAQLDAFGHVLIQLERRIRDERYSPRSADASSRPLPRRPLVAAACPDLPTDEQR